jgi:hypothetical protein
MWKRSHSVLLATAAAAITIGLGAAQATAATWTAKPGGNITGTSGTTTLKDTSTGSVLTCTSSKATGTVKSGTGLAGAGLASIKTATFTNCTGPLGLTFTVQSGHLPWKLNAVSYNSGTGTTTGTITGIHATLTGSGCSAIVDGTGATANNGKVTGTYTNSTHKLKILTTGGNLHIYNVVGCAGLIHSGDASTYTATYAITPGQTITSP